MAAAKLKTVQDHGHENQATDTTKLTSVPASCGCRLELEPGPRRSPSIYARLPRNC